MFYSPLNRLWAFGSNGNTSNILLHYRPTHIQPSMENNSAEKIDDALANSSNFEKNVISGFNLAVSSGPLCNEPMAGVLFLVEKFIVEPPQDEMDSTFFRLIVVLQRASLSGQIISAVRNSFLEAFSQWSPRLLLAVYACELSAPTEVLGRVHGVLSKRRAKIISEEMRMGTPFFNVKATIPVIESFGFSDGIFYHSFLRN
jgi:ribosome assembly protein 1